MNLFIKKSLERNFMLATSRMILLTWTNLPIVKLFGHKHSVLSLIKQCNACIINNGWLSAVPSRQEPYDPFVLEAIKSRLRRDRMSERTSKKRANDRTFPVKKKKTSPCRDHIRLISSNHSTYSAVRNTTKKITFNIRDHSKTPTSNIVSLTNENWCA